MMSSAVCTKALTMVPLFLLQRQMAKLHQFLGRGKVPVGGSRGELSMSRK